MKLRIFREHTNLWVLTSEELEMKRKRILEDAKICFANAIIIACISAGLFFYGLQHLSIVVLFASLLWFIGLVDDRRVLDSIDFVEYMKKEYE